MDTVLHNNEMILGNNTINVGIGLSGNATGPRAKLEINDGSVGVSGLQFRTLTSSFAPGLTASKFLTVDNDGKVILRDIPGSGGSINACSTAAINFVPKWSLLSPTKELCNSLIYDDGAHIGISNTAPVEKLDVDGNINITNLRNSYFLGGRRFLGSGGNGLKFSIELGFDAGPAFGANLGYENIMIGRNTGRNLNDDESNNVLIGTEAGTLLRGSIASQEANNNTFIGRGAGSTITTGTENTFLGYYAGGLYAGSVRDFGNTFIGTFAGSLNSDIGSRNTLLGYDAHLSYDGNNVFHSVALGANSWVGSDNTIVCGVSDATVLMGYNVTPSTHAGCKLYVRGNSDDVAYFDGNIITNSVTIPSDRNLKSNIQNISENEVITVLSHLNPSSYIYDNAGHPSITLPHGQQYGLIADELEAVLPNLVHEISTPAIYDSIGQLIAQGETFKTVNYMGLIPILMKAAQIENLKNDSLANVISSMNSRLTLLEELVENCCSSGNANRNSNKSVELTNSIISNQNSPNPFAEETIIKFIIPSTVIEAKIIFFDNNGAVLKTLSIDERGEGQITVFAENLSAGIYSYSLIVDNKLIDTKKMLCTKK
jgi:hypothetical protein